MRLAHQLMTAGGRDSAADCWAAAQHCQICLPAVRLWIFIFSWNLLRGKMLKCREEQDCKSLACLTVMIWGHDVILQVLPHLHLPLAGTPAVPCPAVLWPTQHREATACLAASSAREGKENPVLNPTHLLLHIEILQERAQEERSACSVNPISIAAVPVRKYLVCSPRSLDIVRNFFFYRESRWSSTAEASPLFLLGAGGNTEQDPPLVYPGVMSDSKAKQNKHVNLSHSCHCRNFPVSWAWKYWAFASMHEVIHVSSPTLESRLLLRWDAGYSLIHQQDWGPGTSNNFFSVFSLPFCQQPVSFIERGPQGDWHCSREVALPFFSGLRSSWCSSLCSLWITVPAHHDQCSLERWQEGLGVSMAIEHGPASLGMRRSFENCSHYARVHARQQQWVQAYCQGLSLEKITRSDERRTEEGISSTLFKAIFSFLAREVIENIFWRPRYPERFESDMATTSFWLETQEKEEMVFVRQIWELWVMLITIPLMYLIWTIMVNMILTFPTVLWKHTKVFSGQGNIILHLPWLLSKGQRAA